MMVVDFVECDILFCFFFVGFFVEFMSWLVLFFVFFYWCGLGWFYGYWLSGCIFFFCCRV